MRQIAEKLSAIAINTVNGSCAEQILQHTGGKGADCGCACVG